LYVRDAVAAVMNPRCVALLMSPDQHELPLAPETPSLPEGFVYRPDVLSVPAEQQLVERLRELPLKEFDFHGFTARRRTISFGWHYDFARSKLDKTDDIPAWLLPLRETVAVFAGLEPDDLPHALILEYSAGATIGWHRDKATFGDVVGISLLSPSRFRLRRKVGSRWERASLTLESRSAYLLRGPSRTEWEHSIPAVVALRYSITFRTLAAWKYPSVPAESRPSAAKCPAT
jgi:alkylated DNA repair dioxygenase AlkB